MKKRGEVVLWAELCPHKIHVESQIPNVTAFEYRAFKEVIRVKEISSVQFSCSVVFDFLRPHGLQHTRPPCPSPTSRIQPNPCPLCPRCHPTISTSVVPFSSCPQSFPALGFLPMSQLFPSGGQSIGVSASTSVLPVNTQD